MKWQLPGLPRFTQHGSEIILLGLIAGGVIWLLGKAIDKSGEGAAAYDLAAFLLVLQAIITAIKDRWTQRSVDNMGTQLAQSNPVHDGGPPPKDAKEAAERVAGAAEDERDQIVNDGAKP